MAEMAVMDMFMIMYMSTAMIMDTMERKIFMRCVNRNTVTVRAAY